MSNLGAALGWKFSHQQGMKTRDDVIIEFPGGVPSQADQNAWIVEYEEYLASIVYAEKRRSSIADGGYGTWQEQLELLGEHGIGAFQRHIASVKAGYPKPV